MAVENQTEHAEEEIKQDKKAPKLTTLGTIHNIMKQENDEVFYGKYQVSDGAKEMMMKATELIIKEMVSKGYQNAKERAAVSKKHKDTVLEDDIYKAIAKTQHFSFLIDTVPREKLQPFMSDFEEY